MRLSKRTDLASFWHKGMHKDGTSAETANADVYVLDSNIIRFLIDRIHFDEGQVLEDKLASSCSV